MGPSVAINNQLAAFMELQKPIYHRTMDLGIRKFKTLVRQMNPGAPKSKINLLIKAYKRRSWMEADGVIRGKGSFPTHPQYGKKVKVTTTGIDAEYDIKVNNGKQQK